MSEKMAYHTRVSSVRVVSKVIVSRNIAGSISWCDLYIGERKNWCLYFFKSGLDRSLELQNQ